MAQINIGKAPSNSAVLPFYATGAIAFVVLCFLLFISADSFTGHYFSPHILTIVHVAALGWGTMIIFGAAHQLLPVICEQDLYSERIASFSWYTLTTGSAFLAFSFWDFRTGWLMISAASLVLVSILLYLVNVLATSRICRRYTIQKMFIASSAIWLLFTATVGLLLAINLHYPFFRQNHMEILKFHAHAGLAGWFLQLITGVSTKLVPMFLLGKSNKENRLKAAFILQNAALMLFISDGYFFEITARAMVYAALMLLGIMAWLTYLFDAYRGRIRRKVELLMKQSFLSFFCLGLSILLIPVIFYGAGSKWTILYGSMLFMGWITSLILGMTFKTLPFIIWNGHYKHLSGKVKVPLPKHIYSEKLIPYQFWTFIAALFSFALAIILQHDLLLRLAGLLWLTVSLIYGFNVLKTLLHKTKTLD